MFFRLSYLSGMDQNDWRDRLLATVEKDGRSDRAISLAANLGPNYLQQIRSLKHAPKLDAVDKLCRVLNISVIWLLTGVELDRDGEELIRLASSASPAQRHHLVELLRAGRD